MLKMDKLSFSYGEKEVLHELNLELGRGEILAVMGPSGCGKSTLLQLIAGLQSPKSGSILCNAKRISYAFQEPRLFPWLTVKENLEAVLPSREDASDRIEKALQTVELADSAGLYPDALSGGMKSRASLARALVYEGDLYLLDEPFSALDEELRKRLCKSLREEIKARGASAILVTHQLTDAQELADRTVQLS